ncbi:MAG: sigma-70 family RNA polymerase sigma factor [Ferruginibacter sp.]|nr:sigma-70 family RNA polymerase sigma factor [Cytophagales bacterium]
MHFKVLPSDQEEKWIRACREGNAAAQRQVYEKYAPRMLGVCIRYADNQFDAEEILINGFLKVFSRMEQFRNEGSFEGWVRKIMVNEALTYLRCHKSSYLTTDLEKADRESHCDALGGQLETEDLLRVIQGLPTGYKTVFNLYAIEGYSHQEIAGMLGISESTSKSQLCRARALLQQSIIKEETVRRPAGIDSGENQLTRC